VPASAGGCYAIEREPILPRGSPAPQETFRIKVDFTSPHSFDVNVFVFRSPADATIVAPQRTAEYSAYCSSHRFRRTGPGATARRVPCKTFYILRQQVFGPALYSAYTDNGKSTTGDFANIVGLASGRSSSR
jgi:hypothetical protein